jgi:hypothetical protein
MFPEPLHAERAENAGFGPEDELETQTPVRRSRAFVCHVPPAKSENVRMCSPAPSPPPWIECPTNYREIGRK